jgi:hypothetical protein
MPAGATPGTLAAAPPVDRSLRWEPTPAARATAAPPRPISLAPAPRAPSPREAAALSAAESAPDPTAIAAPMPADPLASASDEVKRVVRWIAESRDNAGMPHLVIDKENAQVFAFTPAGEFLGATSALLGMARGDRLLAPDDAPMSAMPPAVRITPAGRFVARLAIDSHGKELLVLDYDASISLHAIVKGTPEERRAERIATPTSRDNRISYGCINVPVPFYETIVSPTFARRRGVVYVLPETSSASAMFGFPAAGTTAVAGGQHGAAGLEAPAKTVTSNAAN